ncbi:MAG: pilus assembly protein [Alphaproteobacteria bacterium]
MIRIPSRWKRLLQRLRRSRGASVAVEFGIIAPVTIMTIFGIIEFGRYYWTLVTAQEAAAVGGRYAMTHTSASDSEITAYAEASVYGADGASYSVSRDSTGGVNFVTVQAQFPFSLTIPLLLEDALTVTGTSRVPLNE